LLRERLGREPRDLEARLMLATLLRHTRRLEDARRELELIERFEGSGKWAWEIRQERAILAQAAEASQAEADRSEAVEVAEEETHSGEAAPAGSAQEGTSAAA
jgi:hypothetical protein